MMPLWVLRIAVLLLIARVPITRARVIEEIIVTAQKKEQAAIDVPISMSVLDDQLIAEEGIKDLRDVSLYVPNVSFRPHQRDHHGPGHFVQYPEPPRLFTAQLRYQF
jgi:outer membrane receptor protein involved in Fe transport